MALPGDHLAVPVLEDYSLDYIDENGVPRRENLWTEVAYRKGCWALLVVCYREQKPGGWSGPLFKLVRMRKAYGLWQRISTFNLKPHHFPGMIQATRRAVMESRQ